MAGRLIWLMLILVTCLEGSEDMTTSGFTSFVHSSSDCSMASVVRMSSFLRSRCYQSREARWLLETCQQGVVIRRFCNESCKSCETEQTVISSCTPTQEGYFSSASCQSTWTARPDTNFYVRKTFLNDAKNLSESCSSTPISVLYQKEQECIPDSSGYYTVYRMCRNQAYLLQQCQDSRCNFCLDVFSRILEVCELSSANYSTIHSKAGQGQTIMSSNNISIAEMPCMGFVSDVLVPQPAISLSGSNSKTSMGIADVAINLESVGNQSESVTLQGNLMAKTRCGVLYYTDLRIDRIGTYLLKVEIAFYPSQSTLKDIRLTSQTFHVSYGKPQSIVIKSPARGLRIGYPFKLQPVVHVVDVGQNLVLNAALEVTAVCFPRDVCRLGSWFSNGTLTQIYQDVLRFRLIQGSSAFQNSNLGIYTADRSANMLFTSYPLATAQMRMVLGYNPYRINMVKALPFPLYAGIPIQLLIQLSARYDEPFGWFDRRPAVVQATLFRIKFTTHTEAPFEGNKNATVDYDGLASNEVSLMEVDYVYYFRFTLAFNLDGIDISLPTVLTGTFNVLPGPAYAISPSNFIPPRVSKAGIAMAPQPTFILVDKYGNQNKSWPPPVVAYAEILNQSAFNPLRDGDTLLFGNSRISFVAGVASFTDLLFKRIGNFRLIFASQNLLGFNFTLEVMYGDPSSLLLFQEPSGLLYSKEFDVPPIVHVVDTGNNVVDNQIFTITAELITNGTSFYFWLQPQISWILQNLEFQPLVDNNDLTYYEPALFSTWDLKFNLGALYHIRKVMIKYMLTANGRDITLTSVQLLSNDGTAPVAISTLSNSPTLMDQKSNVSAVSIFTIGTGSPAVQKVIVRVLGTSSGSAPRVSGINFFAGSVPTLTTTTGFLLRNTTMGRLQFSGLMIEAQHKGFFDPQSLEDSNVSLAQPCKMSLRFSVMSATQSIRSVTSRWFQMSHGPVEIRPLTYPTSLAFNETMTPSLVVELLDQYGVVATSGSYAISAVLIRQSREQAVEVNRFDNVSVNGKASFRITSLAAGNFIIRVTCGWIVSDVGQLVVSPGLASNLLLVQEPLDWVAGYPLNSQPLLQVVDAANNLVEDDFYTTVSANLYMNGTSISDGDFPYLTKSIQGIAKFSNIKINIAADNLVIAFGINNSKVLIAFSKPFQIRKGNAQQLLLRRMIGRCVAQQKCLEQPIVDVSDAGGNKIQTSGNLRVTVFSSSNVDVTSDVLPRTNLFPFFAGSLEFSDLMFSKNGTFALSFLAVELELGITSDFFDVTMDASSLEVIVQPSSFLLSGEAGVALVQQPQLAMLDEARKVVSTNALLQAIVYENNETQGVSRFFPSSQDGIFRFTDLVVYKASKCVLIKFVAMGLPQSVSMEALSLPFEIRYGQSSRLQVLQQPARCSVGAECQVPPKVAVMDKFANLIESSDSIVVTASVISAENDNLIDLLADFTQSGVVFFSRLVLTIAGECLFLRFSSFPLASADSDHFLVKPAAPSSLLLVQQPAAPAPGEPLGTQPRVALKDKFGNLCVDAQVKVTATIDHSSRSISIKGQETAGFQDGYAAFTDLRVDTAGSFRLNFTVDEDEAISVASNLLTLTPSTAWDISMLRQPDGIMSMARLQRSPAVAIRDKGGNLVALSGVPITVALRSTLVSLSLSNRTVLTEAGVAVFTDIVIMGKEKHVSLSFTTQKGLLDSSWAYDEIVSVFSDQFDVAGAPYNLSVEMNVERYVRAGAPFVRQPVIRVIDTNNLTASWCPFQTCSVNASLTCKLPESCPVLQGTTQVVVVKGLAIFTDLSLLNTNNGQTFRIMFTLNETISALSSNFTVLPSDPHRISVESMPSQNDILSGISFKVQPRLSLVDSYNNLVPVSTWMSCKLLQAGTARSQFLIYGNSNISVVNGYAQFTDLYCKAAGDGFTLLFSTPLLEPVQSGVFRVTAASEPSSLAFLQSAQGFRSSAPFRIQPSLTAVDAGGNLVPVNEGRVTAQLLLTQPAADVTLVGTSSATFLKGVAAFTDLAVSSASSVVKAQLLFASSNYDAQLKSDYFNVSDSAGARSLTLVQLVSNENLANASFAIQPKVASMDINDVIVDVENTIPVNVSILSSQSCCGYVGYDYADAKIYGTTSILLEKGIGTYTDLRIDKVGRHLLQFFCRLRDGSIVQRTQWIYILINTPSRIDLYQITAAASTGEPLSIQPAVIVVDAGGNRIRDQRQEASVATVTAALFMPDICRSMPQCCSTSASTCISLQLNGLLGQTVQQFDQGAVRFTDLHIDNPGLWSIVFITDGILPAVVAITVQQGSAVQLIVSSQPISVAAGKTFSCAAGVADAGGNIIKTLSGNSYPVRINLNSSNQALMETQDIGVATFSQVRIWTVGSCYRIVWSCDGLKEAVSDIFSVYPGIPYGLKFLQEPLPCSLQGFVAGTTVCKQPILHIVDEGGNNVISSSSYFHVSLSDSKGKDVTAALSGNLMVEYVNGQASFKDLRVMSVGTFYFNFFTTNGAGFQMSSTAFSVITGLAKALLVIVQPNLGSPGYPFSQQPEIQVVDDGYNVVANWTDHIRAELLKGSKTSFLMFFNSSRPDCRVDVDGQLCEKQPGEVLTAEVKDGHASFAGLRIDRAGQDYTIRFSSLNLKSVDSLPVIITTGRPSRLAILIEPYGAMAGEYIYSRPSVLVVERANDVIVQLAIIYDGYGASEIMELSSKSSITRNGIAVFTDIVFSQPRMTYKIRFTAPSLFSADSETFEVLGPTKIKVIWSNDLVIKSGVAFSVQPQVVFLDSHNNSIPTHQTAKVLAEIKIGSGSRNGMIFGNKFAVVQSYPDQVSKLNFKLLD
ncbi:hypothetical protein GUITHDRAFT_100931 [Guillardia theta CCMP2712]|uniref:Uncharacterized protein n=1 Tax=Guillardia theta (strain CCMP2712) TaxID=905079 RepID=L1JXY9_GUITC|nr:hypothetical protein GUITHDRAFT_100931 [Guillardia theta CCMP2712]EKX53222.1 hypothetical protein GUITHDRAFT_100931 [Guillardia theta CCMP2712]|eukprot:XP_005840202.1 hypothetical protein GUITHDRAFT_100931 [Guillardia theta CCMP2712]